MVGARRRDEIARGIRILHLARAGRRGRHFIVFRVSGKASDRVIDVLGLLHDTMDLPRHVPASEDSDGRSDENGDAVPMARRHRRTAVASTEHGVWNFR